MNVPPTILLKDIHVHNVRLPLNAHEFVQTLVVENVK